MQTVGKLKQSPDFDHLLRRLTGEVQAGIHNHCDLGAFSYQAWLHEFHMPGNLHRCAKNHGSHLLVHKRHDMLETNPQSLSAADMEREKEAEEDSNNNHTLNSKLSLAARSAFALCHLIHSARSPNLGLGGPACKPQSVKKRWCQGSPSS